MKLSAAFEASIALSFGDVSDAYQFFPSTLGISDNPDYRANLQHCRITDIDYKRNHAGVSDHVHGALPPPAAAARARTAGQVRHAVRARQARPPAEKRLGVYHNVPIRFRSFRARFLGGLEVRAVWISLRVKGRWTKNRLLLSPTMPPEAIIRLYADRWTIEPMFNSLKHAEGVKSLKHAEGVKSLKHAEGVKELWQRSKEAFHR